MIPVEVALARILAAVAPLPAELIGLADGLGRTLARDLTARVSHPPAAMSAMDGYAVIGADVTSAPVTLRLVGEVAAGRQFDGRIEPGQTVRIFTGAPLPAGADTVVIQENVTAAGDQVLVREATTPGRHVRGEGQDFRQDEVAIAAGTRLTARHLALAAAMNRPWLPVHRRPRIALLATGDELVMPGDPLGAAQIVNSNSIGLAALVRALGGEPVMLGIAADDRDALAGLVDRLSGVDLLVTTGGASEGDHDLVRQVLVERGLALDLWKIAMRPGKPMLFGRLGPTPVLGLPGNPVAAMACALVFLAPALRTMQGLGAAAPGPGVARLGAGLAAGDSRQDYLRATLTIADDGCPVATAFARQDSAMLSTLAAAGCLIIRPPQAPPAAAGSLVPILTFPGALL